MSPRTRHSPEQLDLLAGFPRPLELTEGSLAIAPLVRGRLNAAIDESPLSRHQIAARMSELTADDITIHQLNAWTGATREAWRFPVEYAPAFAAATSSHNIIELLAEKSGCQLLIGREVLTAELGAIAEQEEQLRKRKRHVRTLLNAHNAHKA